MWFFYREVSRVNLWSVYFFFFFVTFNEDFDSTRLLAGRRLNPHLTYETERKEKMIISRIYYTRVKMNCLSIRITQLKKKQNYLETVLFYSLYDLYTHSIIYYM